jgi:hypothetical protein
MYPVKCPNDNSQKLVSLLDGNADAQLDQMALSYSWRKLWEGVKFSLPKTATLPHRRGSSLTLSS